jgi:hypothetical protein
MLRVRAPPFETKVSFPLKKSRSLASRYNYAA